MSTMMNHHQHSNINSNNNSNNNSASSNTSIQKNDQQTSNRIINTHSTTPATNPNPIPKASTTNKIQKEKSWRSSGWAPLSYPSLALYSHPREQRSSAALHVLPLEGVVQGAASSNTITTRNTRSHISNEINPFFPLHKDVILAAARELFILDNAIESSTMQVTDIGTMDDAMTSTSTSTSIDTKKANGNYNSQGNHEDTFNINDCWSKQNDKKLPSSSFSKKSDNNHLIRKRKRGSPIIMSLLKRPPTCTTNNALKTIIIKETLKLKQTHNTLSNQNTNDGKINSNDNGNNNGNLSAKDGTNQSQLTAEALTNLVLQKIINNLHRVEQTSKHEREMEASTTTTRTATTSIDQHSNRIRKVSDVGMDASAFVPIPIPAFSCSTAITSASTSIQSPYAAHLAAVAINLHSSEDTMKDVDMDEKNLLLSLQNKSQMPQMLDLSILVEAHLRQIALKMVHCFRDFVSDKALREFLGYKTAKNGRVLELISDFLFDVSHAMVRYTVKRIRCYYSIFFLVEQCHLSLHY